ncbi:Isochorismatase hydrolase [Epithele typhae]|uniref:Isochorismatase hydrolase n=1 Tax=Epithele typhae TaxID=378194 RepID=UPI00200858FF|nr:Isochorismatase hydrolase [Epithele typhae]KAH9943249.1 Isochorismatase hydrolase [Epithele typhae]
MLVPPTFRPALIIVDVQEDFCPPDGALAVPDGRAIVPTLLRLAALPGFALKVATRDHHPPSHVSFAANHPGRTPFASTTTVVNPANPAERYETRLWPVHCVQGTPGSELVPELRAAEAEGRLDAVVCKGTEPRVEMYSAFRSPLRAPPLASAVSDLEARLRRADVTDVFVVGLAGDYCVASTARDARELGWRTYVVQEGTRCVGGDDGWADTCKVLVAEGVQVVSEDGEEVGWVKALGGES